MKWDFTVQKKAILICKKNRAEGFTWKKIPAQAVSENKNSCKGMGPPPLPTFIFWLLFHSSRGQNRESRSSVFLWSETKRKRLLHRLARVQTKKQSRKTMTLARLACLCLTQARCRKVVIPFHQKTKAVSKSRLQATLATWVSFSLFCTFASSKSTSSTSSGSNSQFLTIVRYPLLHLIHLLLFIRQI